MRKAADHVAPPLETAPTGFRDGRLNRNLALDWLRVGLAFAVVAQHAGFLADISAAGYYLTVNGLFRVAVPVFLLINGFYFYPVLSNRRHFVWLKRLLYLYIFWMAFYLYMWVKPGAITPAYVGNLAWVMFIGYFHLWYLPGLIGAVLLVYAVRNWPLKASLLLVAAVFVLGVAIQYAGAYHLVGNTQIDRVLSYSPTHRNFLFFCFPFVYVGYISNKYRLHLRIPLKVVTGLVVVGMGCVAVEAYLYYVARTREGGFDNYASFLLVCPALLWLLLKIDVRGETKNLALYANGIYFGHVWFLLLYHGFVNVGGTAMTLLVASSSIIGSFFLTKANRRLGFLL